jgi:heme O synthase-like polyprenyltransferase
VGGGYFTWKSIQLVQKPCPARAMSNFFASLAQLCLLLFVAILDPLLLG